MVQKTLVLGRKADKSMKLQFVQEKELDFPWRSKSLFLVKHIGPFNELKLPRMFSVCL